MGKSVNGTSGRLTLFNTAIHHELTGIVVLLAMGFTEMATQ